jgi:hypothetical protein
MTTTFKIQLSATLLLALLLASSAQATDTTKDIVLDRVLAPVVSSGHIAQTQTQTQTQDAMAVSVLLESADGTLIPKSTNTLFRTGDRFRIKLLASRAAKVSLYNTNPRGETNPVPIWQGEVRVGLDTISPRLALSGTSGIDQLHIVMEPTQEPNIFGWLGNWILTSKNKDGTAKDIRLDVQNTPNATYLLNPRGQGLVNTLQIVHTAS